MGVAIKSKTIVLDQFCLLLNKIKEVEDTYYTLYWENLYLGLLESGARINEFLCLHKDDIDLFTGTMRYCVSKKRSGKKIEAVKRMTENFLGRMKEHIEKYKHHIDYWEGYLFFPFSNKRRNKIAKWIQLSTVHNHFNKLRTHVKLDDVYAISKDGRKLRRFSIHSIRHLSGQMVLEEKGIFAAFNHLNHTSIISTMEYLDANPRMKEEISDSFDKVYNPEKKFIKKVSHNLVEGNSNLDSDVDGIMDAFKQFVSMMQGFKNNARLQGEFDNTMKMKAMEQHKSMFKEIKTGQKKID